MHLTFCSFYLVNSLIMWKKCDIKYSTYFGDEVEIETKVVEYNGVRLRMQYEMSVNKKVVATGETKHCFVGAKGRPIRLNKECIELDEILKQSFM